MGGSGGINTRQYFGSLSSKQGTKNEGAENREVVVRRSRVNRFSFEERDLQFAQAIKKNITD